MPQRKQIVVSNSQCEEPHRQPFTQDGREAQLSSLALDLVEARIRAGTASSQEVLYALKLGTIQAQLEREKLEAETALARAKIEAVKSQERSEELFENAIKAMRSYSGHSDDNQ